MGRLGGATLVQIYLWEGNPRAALEKARATDRGMHPWLEIARALEANSPADATVVYCEQIDAIVQQTNNDAYDRAIELARRVRDLIKRVGKDGEFAAWIGALRVRHKAKRNFLQRLDRLVSGRRG